MKFREGWYVIYTRNRHEKKLSGELSELGIQTFLPFRNPLITNSVSRKSNGLPLFPSYLFVFLNSIEQFYSGLHSKSAFYYLRNGKEVATVSQGLIEQLKLFPALSTDLEVSSTSFSKGDYAMITDGVLKGYHFEVIDVSGRKKILIRLQVLQRNLLISISNDFLLKSTERVKGLVWSRT
jgi:transcriptional antiterminator RfaH